MDGHDLLYEAEPVERSVSRRNLLRSGLTVGAAGATSWILAACQSEEVADATTAAGASTSAGVSTSAGASTSASAAASTEAASSTVAQAAGESTVDRIRAAGTARIGADLTFPPLQFRDDSGNPTGYSVELFNMMMADLEVEPEYVDVPFADLFTAMAAGQFDLSAIAATILPSRQLNVWFADEPLFIESEVILLAPGTDVTSQDQLNSADRTIVVQIGSSQEASAPGFFPEATFTSLENQPGIQEVASGRADAMILSEFNIAAAIEATPELTVLQAPPLFVDYNTFFLPHGDVITKEWISNWIRYQTSHGTLDTLWRQWVSNDATAIGLPSTSIVSPFVGAFAALNP